MTKKVCGKSVISNTGVVIGKMRIGYIGNVSQSSLNEDCEEGYVGNFMEFRGETSRVGLNHSMDGNIVVDLGFIENVTCGHSELGHIGHGPLYVINNKVGPSVSYRDGLGIGHMVGNQDVNSSQAKEAAYDNGLGVNNTTESERTNKELGSQRNSGRGQDSDKGFVNERRYQSFDKTSHKNKKKKDEKNVNAFKKHGMTIRKDKRIVAGCLVKHMHMGMYIASTYKFLIEEVIDHQSRGINGSEFHSEAKEVKEVDEVKESSNIGDKLGDQSGQLVRVDGNMVEEKLLIISQEELMDQSSIVKPKK
ncbi:hypothetical protein LWI28_018808 [Acer negundo]|uniref:Uncharacterized protein n=1 Tax=Acer negundo TaxID=4023 RepID=A0AAD5J719_ACENE|nr:hypothetical protein LWI28_018808 [Acer negundo]KAK4850098.1 hypothetical protein QYF36_003854 [Acer negundo]